MAHLQECAHNEEAIVPLALKCSPLDFNLLHLKRKVLICLRAFFGSPFLNLDKCTSAFAKNAFVSINRSIQKSFSVDEAKQWRDTFLARSINALNPEDADLYLHRPLRISVDVVRPEGLYWRSENLTFFSKKGICGGMCLWFLFLYFKTQNLFKDPTKHLMALTELFEKGSRQGTLLQPIQRQYDLLSRFWG